MLNKNQMLSKGEKNIKLIPVHIRKKSLQTYKQSGEGRAASGRRPGVALGIEPKAFVVEDLEGSAY